MRHVETFLVVIVGLAIVAALAWLTTRALEPFLSPAPSPTATPPAVATAVLRIVATAPPRPTATAVPKPLSPSPRPTPLPERESRRAPTAARPTAKPVAPPSPPPPARWSAPRDYRVERAAKLHEAPDAASHVVARLRPDTIVRVVAEQDGWRRIESSLGQRGGWLEAERLRPVER